MGSETPWLGLHPVSLGVNLVPRMWATLRGSWPLLLALVYGRATGEGFFELWLISVFFALAIGGTIVHFLTLRYRVVDGRLEMKSGLLNRQVRVIGAERIQNVEMVRNVFHRMSNMVEVRIETASGTEVEGLLSALSVDDAQALVRALEEARGESRSDEEAEDGELIVSNSLTDLLWYGVTETRLGGLAVLLGVGLEVFGLDARNADPSGLERTGRFVAGFGGPALLLAAVSGAWVLGTATAVVRQYGFRVVRTATALVAERGLFTKRRVVLRPSKVQVVTVFQPWLRRLAGFSSVSIETAAAREGGDGTQRSEALVPVVTSETMASVLDAAIPLHGVDPEKAPLLPAHPRALVRALAASSGRAAVLGALVAGFFFPWGLLAFLLVPIAMGLAWLDHHHQGWLVTPEVIVSRRGWMRRRTWWMGRNKMQSVALHRGPILRRYGLAILSVRAAGSRVELPAMAMDDALRLQHRLLRAIP